MRRIITLFVGLTWVGMGPSPAAAQDAGLAARITALEATIAVQSTQIATLLGNGQIQSALNESAGNSSSTGAGTGALANNEADGYSHLFGGRAARFCLS